MKYDVFKQIDYHGKISEKLVIGGYESFTDAVTVCDRLTEIRNTRKNDRMRHFTVKVCKHIEPDERMRDSIVLDRVDRQHSAIVETNDLINAYFDM